MVKLVQNNDYVFKFTVTDQDGTAVNLDQCDIYYSINRTYSGTPIVEKSTASGIAITNAAGGVFEVTLTKTDLLSVDGDYYSEALIVDANGKETTITPENINPQVINFRKKITFTGD